MSSINPNNIDGTYPIAGQDNDSQGFRDNFTNIKNNLKFAQEELADLQARAVLNEPLGSVGQTSTASNNELNYAQLSGAQLVKSVYTTSNIGVPSTDPTISFASGNFQRLILDQSRSITFSNWPTTQLYAKLRLQVTVANTSATLTLPSAVTSESADLIQNCTSKVISFPATGTFLYELSTYDAGGSITLRDLQRNTDSVASDFTVTGTTTTNGNLVIAGGRRDTGYLYVSSPASDFATQANVGVSRVIFDPSTTLAKGTLTLPAGNVEATVIRVSSTADITAFAVKGYGNVIVKPSANITLSAGTGVEYFYKASEWTWYKTQ